MKAARLPKGFAAFYLSPMGEVFKDESQLTVSPIGDTEVAEC
jgi:hypothetical protein